MGSLNSFFEFLCFISCIGCIILIFLTVKEGLKNPCSDKFKILLLAAVCCCLVALLFLSLIVMLPETLAGTPSLFISGYSFSFQAPAFL
jgi:hypothetical protein